MSAQHTPGPWAHLDFGKWQGVDIGAKASGKNPCVIHWSGFDGCGLPQPEYAANARLIAAAPDLLEALEAVIPPATTDWWCPECQVGLPGSRVTNDERCDTCGTYLPPEQADDERWQKARAAITKAKGEA